MFYKGIKGIPGFRGQKGDLGEDGPRVCLPLFFSTKKRIS